MGDGLGGGVENVVVDEWGLGGLLVVGVGVGLGLGWDECWFGGSCGVPDQCMWLIRREMQKCRNAC